jgi:hypothetical protein
MEVVSLMAVYSVQSGLSYRCNPHVGISCVRELWEDDEDDAGASKHVGVLTIYKILLICM